MRSVRALPHLNERDDERHFAGTIDAQERIRCEGRIGRQRVAELTTGGQTKAQQQPAADGSGRDQKLSPRGRG